MANPDFERMIKLGEWLEKFLSPDTKSWGYLNLAKEFIDLYDMAFDLSSNDITIQALALIKDDGPQIEKRYIESLKKTDEFLELGIKLLVDAPNSETGKLDLLYQKVNDEGKKILSLIQDSIVIEDSEIEEDFVFYDFIEYSQKKIAKTIETSFLIKGIFQSLSENSKPWEYCLFQIFQRNRLLMNHYNERTILHGYNGLVEELIVNENGTKKQKTFRREYEKSFSTLEHLTDSHWEVAHPSAFPWEVAVSRIFFDFLFLGGQEYFLFCKYCEKFTVIKRKGRKKFCSDICRTANRNAELAKL